MNPLKYWTTNTFEISSYKWHLSEKVNKSYRYSGSDDTGKCIYTYNELGFRGDSIHKEGFKVMSLGCSHTEGVGVNNNETWPAQFTKLIPNGVNHNFGMGGRSNDYISRCLLTYYELVKPDLVLIMYTSPQRREIYTKENEIEPFMPTHSWGYLSETEDGKKIQSLKLELQNDNEDFINWYKNHLLIKYFLESKKCNWIWNGSFLNTEYLDNFRFDGNYLNFIDFGVDGGHSGPKNNYQYSIKLSEHIKDKFRDYLPKDTDKITEKVI